MPDKSKAQAQYSRHAATYDQTEDRVALMRRAAIERLALIRGDTVLDVGCGTGLSFPLLEESIGSEGRIIGIDQSPEMLVKARERGERAGWSNVTLIESSAAEASIPTMADAALFHFTHDIMRTPRAIENVVRQVCHQGRVVAIGLKWAPWWHVGANLIVWRLARAYTTTFEGLAAPWTHVGELIPEMTVESLASGGVYLASGIKR